MRASVTLALAPWLFAICSFGAAQPVAVSGNEAVRRIDWSAVDRYSPIPELMPKEDSDDPLEAGFAPQWIERALNPNLFPSAQFALKIISKTRTPEDEWSLNMRKELRALVRSKIAGGSNTRVFCNTIGCLCYVERDEPNYLTDPIVYRELRGKSGAELHLNRQDLVDAIVHPHRPGVPWELTIIRHPTRDSSNAGSQVPVSP